MTYKLIGNQSEMTGSINFKSCKIMRNDFTVGNHEVDNKSFGIGAAVTALVIAAGYGIKFGVKKGMEFFAKKKAEKAQQKQEAE